MSLSSKTKINERYLDSTVFSSIQKLIQKPYNSWKSYMCYKNILYNIMGLKCNYYTQIFATVTFFYVYRMSLRNGTVLGKGVKRNKKVLYHFAIFAIINKLLIIKNRDISPAYRLMQARGEMRLPSDRGC